MLVFHHFSIKDLFCAFSVLQVLEKERLEKSVRMLGQELEQLRATHAECTEINLQRGSFSFPYRDVTLLYFSSEFSSASAYVHRGSEK